MQKYKNFEIKSKTKKTRQVPKVTETTTYCVNCNFTCDKKCCVHNKRNCSCMDNDYCTVCPGKCHLNYHKDRDYIVEYYEEETIKIDENMKKEYELHKKNKEDEKEIYKKNETQLKDKKSELLGILKPIHNEFKKICNKKYNFSDLDVIEGKFNYFFRNLN